MQLDFLCGKPVICSLDVSHSFGGLPFPQKNNSTLRIMNRHFVEESILPTPYLAGSMLVGGMEDLFASWQNHFDAGRGIAAKVLRLCRAHKGDQQRWLNIPKLKDAEGMLRDAEGCWGVEHSWCHFFHQTKLRGKVVHPIMQDRGGKAEGRMRFFSNPCNHLWQFRACILYG